MKFKYVLSFMLSLGIVNQTLPTSKEAVLQTNQQFQDIFTQRVVPAAFLAVGVAYIVSSIHEAIERYNIDKKYENSAERPAYLIEVDNKVSKIVNSEKNPKLSNMLRFNYYVIDSLLP